MKLFQEEEDTWISGEELKTEGSSGSDDDVPRRKISPRKSRRRRSEGYTPPESRLSLPNLADNKTGIAFRVSKPEDKDLKSERFSVGGESCADEERMMMEAAMARMSTRSSLDKTEQICDFSRSDNEWRPKRGSLKLPNLDEGTSGTVDSWDWVNVDCELFFRGSCVAIVILSRVYLALKLWLNSQNILYISIRYSWKDVSFHHHKSEYRHFQQPHIEEFSHGRSFLEFRFTSFERSYILDTWLSYWNIQKNLVFQWKIFVKPFFHNVMGILFNFFERELFFKMKMGE